jgi:hypothetical protein
LAQQSGAQKVVQPQENPSKIGREGTNVFTGQSIDSR